MNKYKTKKKLMLVGGGTGGHVVPIYQLYKNLKDQDPNLSIYIIGSGSEIEKQYYQGLDKYIILNSGKFRRYWTIKNIFELIRLLFGFVKALIILISIEPKLIFTKGSHVAVPIIYWAKILKIPYFVHESDAEAGVTNKFAFKSAKKIFTGFPLKFYQNISTDKAEYSGQIFSKHYINKSPIDYQYFNFSKPRKTIFVTGGSQGSMNINKNFVKIVRKLLEEYNIIHQTGPNDYFWVNEFRNRLNQNERQNYFVKEYMTIGEKNVMSDAIRLSDLVISRAGATTIAEIASFEKAMILIPYKYAAGNHQEKNANYLLENKAACIIEDDQLSARQLLQTINQVTSTDKIKKLGENAKKHFGINGLNLITKEIFKEIS